MALAAESDSATGNLSSMEDLLPDVVITEVCNRAEAEGCACWTKAHEDEAGVNVEGKDGRFVVVLLESGNRPFLQEQGLKLLILIAGKGFVDEGEIIAAEGRIGALNHHAVGAIVVIHHHRCNDS